MLLLRGHNRRKRCPKYRLFEALHSNVNRVLEGDPEAVESARLASEKFNELYPGVSSSGVYLLSNPGEVNTRCNSDLLRSIMYTGRTDHALGMDPTGGRVRDHISKAFRGEKKNVR